jgi:hypothetical protein
MATQNLFDKYGIKEVADVTFYRIEKKEETYESQRTITISSILKGAMELQTVYPLEKGKGSEDGFEAYVFTDAELVTGTNYDCDDVLDIKEVITGTFKSTERITDKYITSEKTLSEITADEAFELDEPTYYDAKSGAEISDLVLSTYYEEIKSDNAVIKIKYSDEEIISTTTDSTSSSDSDLDTADLSDEDATTTNEYSYTITIYVSGLTADSKTDKTTGVYEDSNDSKVPDATREVGTHEYTYEEQVLMLFAKKQNIISKTGVRYQFANADSIFGEISFNDSFAAAPNSTEKIVVIGLDGKFTESTYDVSEVIETIKSLTETFEAKAYDVVYNDYAELVVEDEMGYFNPYFLGKDYNKSTKTISPFVATAKIGTETVKEKYMAWAVKNAGVDRAIATAEMWGNDEHYSINDAIDALKQKKKIIDVGEADGAAGIESIFGGYKVVDSNNENGAIPAIGKEDTDYAAKYIYSAEGVDAPFDVTSPSDKYPLDNVIDAISEIAYDENAIGKDIRVDAVNSKNITTEIQSNRAIYVKVDGSVDTAAGAYIYLLHNKNYKKLTSDSEGVFSFEDKKGNTLYYQDKIFKGIEYLALVIIGNKGLIFVVNRHGKSDTKKIAWMINENGYVSDTRTATLVKKGLIHTTDITANDETFEATCTVKSLGVHRVTKKTNHYIPVLFLDTLKISTIEQTAEEVYATGGRGNANLIGWDYGKEITVSLEDALFTPASMSAMFGSYEGNDFRKGVKETKSIDRMEKVTAKRSFIVPAGNSNGTPTEADKTAQAVFYDPNTMEPYADGTPIAEGEIFYKFTRSIAYDGQSIGHTIEISADKFPGTYKIVGDTFVRSKETGEDERFQFVIPQFKVGSENTITLEADGDPAVNSLRANAAVKIA